jgi:Skp family chaperone for outer membrane proteins
MKPTLNEKFLAYLALFSGLFLSLVAEYYSILGLTAIFAAAAIPVVIMGIALGLGKVTATLWLKQNWSIAPWSMRIYLFTAIIVLMLVTSMGIFGFLSKAHSDQNLVSGDVQSKIAVYDEKIKTERENIDANRKALKQLDESVDQVMGRSQDEKGAEKAVAIRRAQQKERSRLAQDISEAQKRITALNEERAPIAAEVRKVEAEVGPIKYIAAFVYGETSEGILEKAVTWVIITLIVVFDPMAVILLLSSQISFQNFRDRKNLTKEEVTDEFLVHKTIPAYEPDDGPLTDQQIEQIKETANPPEEEKSILEQHPYLTKKFDHFENLKPMVYTPPETVIEEPVLVEPTVEEVIEPVVEPIPESLFVQNEEQKESNLWSTTTAENITPEEYMKALMEKFEQEPKIAKLAIMVRTGRMDINSIPEDIREEVRKKV